MECLAAEMCKHVVGQVVRGVWGIEAGGACGLHDLRVEGGGRSVHAR